MPAPIPHTSQLQAVTPPQNLDAEQAALGSILIDQDAITKIADLVTPDDFYKSAHGMIFESMLKLYERREPIDVLSLSNQLQEARTLEQIGGKTYLLTLANSVPTAANVQQYATIVQRKATLRRLISAAQHMTKIGFDDAEDVDAALDQAEQELFKVTQKYLKNNFIPLHTVLTEAFERIDEIHREAGKLRGVPTGYQDLDRLLGGLQKSDLVILAARPSMGKTALALDIARNAATKHKVPVGIFSLEMSQAQLVDRMLSAQAGVDMWKMRTGRLGDNSADDDFPRIGHAMGILSESPIYIDDSATTNIMEMRTKARRLQSEYGLGLLIIDYLQLMEGRASTENRVQEVSEISRGLKGLARELNIPVLALSQLSRAVEMGNPPIPKLSHLRESGSIEQDADVVMFIYREEYYKKGSDKRGIAEIIVSKHRNGPTGQIELYFDQEKVSFKNLQKLEGGFTPPPPEMLASEATPRPTPMAIPQTPPQ